MTLPVDGLSAWAPAVATRPRWRDQRTLERTLNALFALVAMAALARVVALGHRLLALDEPAARDFFERARDADAVVDTATTVMGLAALALAPCFIVWIWRAAKNQHALGREPERLGSGWALGGWFVPLANFVIPVLVAQDLWRGSDIAIARGDPRWRIGARSWLIGWWWGLFLVPMLGWPVADAGDRTQTLSELRGANLLALVTMLAACAAAVLGLLVVRRLDERQETCRAAWGDLGGH